MVIPETVENIGDRAFSMCYNLQEITIPGSVKNIGAYMFMESALATVFIGEGVESIGITAFGFCSRLTHVTIPSSVTSIATSAFVYCMRLESAEFAGDAPTMGVDVFLGASSGFTVFYQQNATGFTTPTWNGYAAQEIYLDLDLDTQIVLFEGGSYSIDVSSNASWSVGGKPDWVSVSPASGSGDATLAVEVEANSRSISRQGIINIAGIEHVITQYGDTRDFTYVDNGDDIVITGYTGNGGAVEIPSTINGKPVAEIGAYAFKGNGSFTRVEISDGVLCIGLGAFETCNSLTSISVPASVTSIGISAFSYCSSLTSIEVDSSNLNYASVTECCSTRLSLS
jgi:hypothetical protein